MLLGTLTPGACRLSIDTKNAFNNGIGSANAGGFFGPELKFAGFDHVIIQGKSEEPVYLWIKEGKAEIKNGSEIWGKTTWETERFIRNYHNDDRIRVSSIGPAGENLVRSACIMNDRACAAGGSGVGAVMGSKNLKALAARGSQPIFIAKPKNFIRSLEKAMKKINKYPKINELRKKGFYGAMGGTLDAPMWKIGYRPVRNGQDDYWDPKRIAKIGEPEMKKIRKKTVSCFSCPISCKPWMEIKEGPFKIQGEGWWNNSSNSFCTKFDNINPEAAVYAHLLTNQLGLDGDNAAQVISWAFECFEKGIVTQNNTNGLKLTWGNYKSMIKMLEKLAYRDGFGDLLAEGGVRAAKKIGKNSGKYVMHIKKQDSLDGVRISKGWGFGIVLSPVGGRHLRGVWRPPGMPVNSYEGVPEGVFQMQQQKAVQDILGICSYTYGQTIEDWASFASSLTGRDLSVKKLMKIGLQVHNLEKAFNTFHAGFTRKDDYPCDRYYNEPVKSGPYKGERIHHEIWEKMLDKHYKIHGWDEKTGRQTKNGLNEIGLADVAEKLEKAGKIL
jgi:aldehyde:ferredoxin oxidoreductase